MAMIQTQAVKKLPFIDNGNVYYVAPGGNNLTAQKGNPYKPWADVWTAVDLAQNRELVYVFAGRYDTGVQAGRNLAKDGVYIHFERCYFQPISGPTGQPLFRLSGLTGEQMVSGEACFWDINPYLFDWGINQDVVSTAGAVGFRLSLECYAMGTVAYGANEAEVIVNAVEARESSSNVGLCSDRNFSLSGTGLLNIQYNAKICRARYILFHNDTNGVRIAQSFESGRIKAENSGINALWGAGNGTTGSNNAFSIHFDEAYIRNDNAAWGCFPQELLNFDNNEFTFTAGSVWVEQGALWAPTVGVNRVPNLSRFVYRIGSLFQNSGTAIAPNIDAGPNGLTHIHIDNCYQGNVAAPVFNVRQVGAGGVLKFTGNYFQATAGQPIFNVPAVTGSVIINASGQGGTGLVGSANCAAVLYQDSTGTTVI